MHVLVGLCRSSYYISLLGLKIPAGLVVRASRAHRVLAFFLFVWVPFLVYCHVALLPSVRALGEELVGLAVWHAVTAVWITIPLLVVGAVVLSRVCARGPFAAFAGALAAVALFHALAIPALAPTRFGGWLLQALFVFFEDFPALAWIWCLGHVLRLQVHVRRQQKGRGGFFLAPGGQPARTLVVGNAPTITEGAPLGHVIDDFAHVVRFNGFRVDRPEFTGSKVGFHFCNGRNFPSSGTVKAVLPLFNASLTHAVYLFMPHMEDACAIYDNLTSTKVDSWFAEEEQILELRKKIGCRVWQIPTSGMVAVDSFLKDHSSITLHGFNFFQGKKIHYFEESPTQLITSWLERFVTHSPAAEKRWVEGLAAAGRVSFLAQSPFEEKETEATQREAVAQDAAASEASKLEGSPKAEKGEVRRRPGLFQALLKDGLPSQFSL